MSDAKASHWTVFVGQLPFRATKKQIEVHFSGDGFSVPVKAVRMLTDRATGKFKGMAFVEFQNADDFATALKMDYSVLQGRRIRIERTLAGGGHGEERKKRLKKVKTKDREERKLAIAALLEESFGEKASAPAAHNERRLSEADLDEPIREFLLTIPIDVAKESVAELGRINLKKVRNRRRYIMGLLKRKVKEMADAEGTSAPALGREQNEDNTTEDTGRTVTLAKSYQDDKWYEATISAHAQDPDKVIATFDRTGRQQETLKADIKEKTRRKKRKAHPDENQADKPPRKQRRQ